MTLLERDSSQLSSDNDQDGAKASEHNKAAGGM